MYGSIIVRMGGWQLSVTVRWGGCARLTAFSGNDGSFLV